MKLPLFIESHHCKSRAHCQVCRHQGPVGRKLRLSWMKHFQVPGNVRDFKCPAAYPWGYVPPKQATDQPGAPFADTSICRSGGHCTLCRAVSAGRDWRREQFRRFKVPNNVLDFPCPYGKPWQWQPGKGQESPDGLVHVLIHHAQGAGDAVALTGAIRDLHAAYPNRFKVAIRGGRMELYRHNPLIHPVAKVIDRNGSRRVRFAPNQYKTVEGKHFAQGFRNALGKAIGVTIPLIRPEGDIQLSEEEKAQREIDGPYWLLFASGKNDFTVKHWPEAFYQRVIDQLPDVKFVRVGDGPYHPKLTGCIDLYRQTDLRRLIRLMYHAEGGIGPVSFGMHLSAAVPMPNGEPRPYVVLAGGGESPSFIQYEGHKVLDTIGQLPCCASAGCFKFKAEIRGTDCLHPDCADVVHDATQDHHFARCMTMVTPERVADAVRQSIAERVQWTPDMPSRGVGDTVRKFTEGLGKIAAAAGMPSVQATMRKCGGCKKRQVTLNQLVPFK